MRFRSRVVACAWLVVALGSPVFISATRAGQTRDQPSTAEQDPRAPDYKSNLPADHPAVRYGRGDVDDPASRLAQQIERGSVSLDRRDSALGVVPALLQQLGISTDSQMLVFSKTSFQAARISPKVPRAIYFTDDAVVAYVPGAPTLEIVAIDAVQGPMFYTMPIGAAGKPVVAHGQTCLRCHHGPNTAGVPGIYVGSVIPGPNGAPLRDDSAIVTDHRSPFAERWGGWYVTAKRGEQRDRANAVALNPADPTTLVRESQQNLPALLGRFDHSLYPASTSDIVALMTFEHQTQMINLLTRVAWDARIRTAASKDGSSADLQVRVDTLDADIDDLVRYMLFAGEAPLEEPIEGASSFTNTFPQRGPRDSRGRSLRDFDLKTRLFKYPLSYLIYSPQFDALPTLARDRIYRRLYDVLTGADLAAAFAHLTSADRQAILEILRDTKSTLPEYWRSKSTIASRR